MIQISIGKEKVERISDKPLRYISKSSIDFINHMESEGYNIDQMGSLFPMQKGNDHKVLSLERFMIKYVIFSE